MVIRPFVPAVLSAAVLWAAASCAQAACPITDDPCTLDLGNATVTFGQGWSSVVAQYQVNGSEGQDGSGWADAQFGLVQTVQNGSLAGFSLAPTITANVYNGGNNGLHEVFAWISLNGVSFAAKPGYQLDSLTFTVSGTFGHDGTGQVHFDMPAPPVFGAGTYVSTAPVGTSDTSFYANVSTSSYYQANDDGTAAVTGSASASIDGLSLVAHVSPVPEPQTLALFGLGLRGVGAYAARRRPN